MKLLLLLLFSYCCRLHAQDSSIHIKAGMSVNEAVSVTGLYQYPQFSLGKVFFKSGDSTMAKLNYHTLLDEMLFINSKGDTLSIANAATIRSIRINSDLFYYDEGFVKLIQDINGIKLASKQTLRLAGKDKIGAYGMANPTSAIDSYGTLIDQRGTFNLVPREDITLAKKTVYYFGDKYNRFVWAIRKNLLKHFPKHSGSLSAYLKDNDVNLNSTGDLEKLLQFLAGL